MASGSGWNLWVWLLGVVVISSYYLSLLLLYMFVFTTASLLLFIFKMFFVLYIYIVGHFHFAQRCLIENYYTFICVLGEMYVGKHAFFFASK